ncbi:hypothetical protein PTI98_001898 [Pleurotus ostreatus]|nr:hypothetical protein PTI98_001898 [Pleurotus ostreatus]
MLASHRSLHLEMTPQITLYTTKSSPFGHYVEIALREARADYSVYEVDLVNKPPWYTDKVNPAGKVPAISYGGSPAPADAPSPSSFKLAESLVILDFIIDIFPESNLLPIDPVARASTRFLLNLFSTTLRTACMSIAAFRGSPEEVLDAIDKLQVHMPAPGSGRFVTGDTFTSVDAVAAAYLLRFDRCLERDIGSFPEGEGVKAYHVLRTSERFTRYRAYLATLAKRESVKASFPEEKVLAQLGHFWVGNRAFA